MSTLKKFRKYIIWIALFWIFSDVMIYLGLNSTYKNISNIEAIPKGINVVQMQSTKVNGRMKLEVSEKEYSDKYLKIDLYSNIGNILGTEYVELGDLSKGQTKTIEKYFKITDVRGYKISVVDTPEESSEGFMDTAISTIAIVVLLLKLLVL